MSEDRKRLRLFLDSNVLTGGMIARWGLDKAILSLCAARVCRLVLSEVVRGEVGTNLLDHASDLSLMRSTAILEDYENFLRLANAKSAPYPDQTSVLVSRHLIAHATDVPVLLSAVQARPDWLLSHNTKHFTPQVARATGLNIATPIEFSAILPKAFAASRALKIPAEPGILREYTIMFKLFLLLPLALLPISAQSKSYVLKAARIFDGNRITAPGLVVITGTKIFAVGPASAIPAGAEVIDFGDATLSPGFMDAHTHLSMDDSGNFQKMLIDGLQQTIPEQTLRAVENLRKTLRAGFTTVRDVGSHDFLDVGLRNAVRAGKIEGPRMLVAVHALGSTGGHCDDQGGFRQGIFGHESGPEDGVINSPEQARYAVRLDIKYGADVIKTCATGGVLSLTDEIDTPQLTQEELNALVDEAHALRKKTAAHAHGATGAKRAIRAGIDSIEHGTFLDDEALDMMKQRGTVWIPTLMALEGGKAMIATGSQPPAIEAKMRLAIESMGKTFRNALAHGVIIGLGTDAAVYPHGRNAEEFHQLVDLGMDPVQALRAGTSIDAKLLGVDGFTGTLEAGKMADVVVVPGDPSRTIRNTEKLLFVMKEGAVIRR